MTINEKGATAGFGQVCIPSLTALKCCDTESLGTLYLAKASLKSAVTCETEGRSAVGSDESSSLTQAGMQLDRRYSLLKIV